MPVKQLYHILQSEILFLALLWVRPDWFANLDKQIWGWGMVIGVIINIIQGIVASTKGTNQNEQLRVRSH
jgi:hypothetical protein